MPISHYFSRYFYGVTRDVNGAKVKFKWAVFDVFPMMPFGPCPTSPEASVSLMFLPHFDVFCDLLLNGPTATWNLFVLYNDQKRKKTHTHTCLIPLDCLRICASLGSINVQNANFRLCFFFFSLSYLYTVSFIFQRLCFQQNFAKQRVSYRWHTLATVVKISCSLGILKFLKTSFCLRFSIFLLCK